MTEHRIVERSAPKASDGARTVYFACGLTIESEILLHELSPQPPLTTAPDLVIRHGDLDDWIPGCPRETGFDVGAGQHLLCWPQVGCFLIRGPGEIVVDALPDVDALLLSLPLLGTVMAVVQHLWGRLVLHGSALGIGDAGAIFLGDKGAGKSTTAAAMLLAGHRLLTDDVVAVDLSGADGPLIIPSFAHLKLTDSAEAAMPLEHTVTVPSPHPDFPKHRKTLTRGFADSPLPVDGIYVLQRGSRAEIRPLSPTEAFPALMRYSYIARFGDRFIHGESAANHLRQCVALAGRARVGVLEVPESFARIPEAVRLVEAAAVRDLSG